MAAEGPRTEKIKLFILAKDHNIGIQINQKELAETFMVFSNWKNPLVSTVYTK